MSDLRRLTADAPRPYGLLGANSKRAGGKGDPPANDQNPLSALLPFSDWAPVLSATCSYVAKRFLLLCDSGEYV